MLALCPDPAIRDPQSAKRYAATALARAPKNPRYLSTQALTVLLADDDAAAATEILQRVKATRGYWIDRDHFVAALAEHAGGQSDRAELSFNEGIQWMDEHRPHNVDSQRLREFVTSALGSEEE
jgi:hypothetical protein